MDQITNRAQKAIQQLNIKTNNRSKHDGYQLTEILIQILDYPNIPTARKHEMANHLGNYDLIQQRNKLSFKEDAFDMLQKQNICQCCGVIINKSEIPFCTSLSQIHIGRGTRLYFSSILFNIVIFLIASIIYSIYSIITNYQSYKDMNIINSATLQVQSESVIDSLSLSYKIKYSDAYNKSLLTQSVLALVTVLVWGAFNIIKIHIQKKMCKEINQQTFQVSDFTLMVQDFPSQYLRKSNSQTLEYIQTIFNRYHAQMKSQCNYKIAKVNVARNLYIQNKLKDKQKIQRIKKIQQKKQVFKDWIVQRKKYDNFSVLSTQRQRIYQQYLQFVIRQQTSNEQYKGITDQKVIIFLTFQQSETRREIAQNTRPGTIFNLFNVCHTNLFPIEGLTMVKAPPPEEIKWLNIGFPKYVKVGRTLVIYLISIVLLAASLGITYGLSVAQQSLKSQQVVSILTSLVITVVNFGLQFTLMFLSRFINEKTQTNLQFNIAFKVCLFQILNSIGVPLLARYVFDRSLQGQGGISVDIFYIGLFNIFTPIGRFVDPYNLWINLRNKYYQNPDHRLQKFDGQCQFNKIYDDNNCDLGFEYAYVVKTSIFTAFFMVVQPILAPFAIIGLTIMFFVNKYRILYRFYKPNFNSSSINSLINYMLSFSPLFFALGHLVFQNWSKTENIRNNQVLNWIIFGIAGLFVIFPSNIVYKYLHGRCIQKIIPKNTFYSEKRSTLQSQYDRMNPITRSMAISEHKQYLNQRDKKVKLSKNEQLINQNLMRECYQDVRKSMLRSTLGKSIIQEHYSPAYIQNMETYSNLIKSNNNQNNI